MILLIIVLALIIVGLAFELRDVKKKSALELEVCNGRRPSLDLVTLELVYDAELALFGAASAEAIISSSIRTATRLGADVSALNDIIEELRVCEENDKKFKSDIEREKLAAQQAAKVYEQRINGLTVMRFANAERTRKMETMCQQAGLTV